MLTSDSLAPKPSILIGFFVGNAVAISGILFLLLTGGR